MYFLFSKLKHMSSLSHAVFDTLKYDQHCKKILFLFYGNSKGADEPGHLHCLTVLSAPLLFTTWKVYQNTVKPV